MSETTTRRIPTGTSSRRMSKTQAGLVAAPLMGAHATFFRGSASIMWNSMSGENRYLV
jgi:hypothetical protein